MSRKVIKLVKYYNIICAYSINFLLTIIGKVWGIAALKQTIR